MSPEIGIHFGCRGSLSKEKLTLKIAANQKIAYGVAEIK